MRVGAIAAIDQRQGAGDIQRAIRGKRDVDTQRSVRECHPEVRGRTLRQRVAGRGGGVIEAAACRVRRGWELRRLWVRERDGGLDGNDPRKQQRLQQTVRTCQTAAELDPERSREAS